MVRTAPRERPVSLFGGCREAWSRYRPLVRSSSGAVPHSSVPRSTFCCGNDAVVLSWVGTCEWGLGWRCLLFKSEIIKAALVISETQLPQCLWACHIQQSGTGETGILGGLELLFKVLFQVAVTGLPHCVNVFTLTVNTRSGGLNEVGKKMLLSQLTSRLLKASRVAGEWASVCLLG